MKVWIEQEDAGGWQHETTIDKLLEHLFVFCPLIVETQAEFDYLWSMQLMIGKEFTVLLKDRDENTTDLPPSFVKIDIPL